ncbi:unnamed protein product (macronuclear) [Paramecium tetraurelia]|uniref:Intimal thickness related receptor IRP domain-containing protein n=1 Tax=Paramecium tetraurelia TaxID=5888 RepID=A0BC99_PARTE|nr:uncharacterized protein GSPATT00004260001 [Paramecium tetraurelia]CAK56166.1 unnamed protein product [Paramecium tetraurelia]|eukprot:XP_001423564.1 hypothetical protein (macronuclear) [Paramecium tetraurelia strain d4-2]
MKQYKFHFRSLLICLISLTAYYSVCAHLYLNVSPHWVWSLYLSPIFVVSVILFSMFYVSVANQKQTQSDSEEDFCITLILLTFMLIWWPIFIIIYLQIFENVLIPFESQTGILIERNTSQFFNEDYATLIFNLSDDSIGIGCQSNQYDASIVEYPLPYKYYDMGNEIKLPSWFCLPLDTEIKEEQVDLYVSTQTIINDMAIITFQYPNFISESFWIAFITTIFQFACIFSSILLLAILLIMDQQSIESNIRKPSRKKRIINFILSFTLYVFMISCNSLIITLTSVLVGLLFLIWSLFNKIHNHFYQMIKGMFKMVTHWIQYIPITIIAIILISIYVVFILIVSQCVIHFKIFLCRHFVALWKGQMEEQLEGYDKFINKITVFTWIWNIILIALISTQANSVPLMAISIILCVIQLVNIPIILIFTPKRKIFEQQWCIYYTNYKIINQQCTDHEQQNQFPMDLREIELHLQDDKISK